MNDTPMKSRLKHALIERVKASRDRMDSWDVQTPTEATNLEWDDHVDFTTPFSRFLWTPATPLVGSPAMRLFSWAFEDLEEFEDHGLGERIEDHGLGERIKIEVDGAHGENSENCSGDDGKNIVDDDEVFTASPPATLPSTPCRIENSQTLNVCLGSSDWNSLIQKMDHLCLSAKKLSKTFDEICD